VSAPLKRRYKPVQTGREYDREIDVVPGGACFTAVCKIYVLNFTAGHLEDDLQ
jgi:hypothetical protein